MEFPAITLCNMSPRSRKKIGKHSKIDNFWKSMSAFSATAKSINWSDPEYEDLGFFKPRIKADVLKESIELKTFVKFAMFDLHSLDIEESFDLKLSVFGLCYTWNRKGTAQTLRKGLMNNLQMILNITAADNTWSFDVAGGVKVSFGDCSYLWNLF